MDEPFKIENPFIVKATRDFDVPIEQVFDAWLDAAQLGQWFFATSDGIMEQVEVDARVGGKFLISERRDGVLAKHLGTYHVIDRPHKLVFSFVYEAEETSSPSTVSVEFLSKGNGCTVNLTHELDNKYAEFEASAIEGWNNVLTGLSSIF